jgi:hypothetical protein
VVGYIALVVALGGGGAYAATSLVGKDGAIKGCVSKRTGVMRVVKAGTRCRKGETRVVFNQKGPKGEPGARGDTGPRGDRGTAIVARARFAGSQTIAEGSGQTVIPLTGGAWTQQADELDQLAGYVKFLVEGSGSCSMPVLTVTIKDNDSTLGTALAPAASPVPAPIRIGFVAFPSLGPELFEPGAPTAHSLSASATTNCSGGATVRVTEIVVDVVGVA